MRAEPTLSQQLRDALAEQVRIGLRVPTSLIVKATASLDDLERQLATAKTEPASGWARQVSLESIKGYLGPARRGILSDREWLNIIERLHQLWMSKESEAAQTPGSESATRNSDVVPSHESAPASGPDAYPQERVDAVTQAGMDALRQNRLQATPRTDAAADFWDRTTELCRQLERECASLRAVADAAKAELENIAIAQRFDKDQFEDDSSFADWARSRARHTLDAVRALEGKS